MRLLKICSLLFSLGQFLLILKLIELVRGNPVSFNNQENELHPQLQQEEEERSFFLAPSKVKQKNYKRWGDGSNTTITTTENIITATDIDRLGIENDEEYYQFEPPSSELNSTSKSNNSIITKIQANTDSSGEERLCPGCQGTCGQNVSAYGFPVIGVVVAIIIGIIWFFVFLFLWYFASEPIKTGYTGTSYGYSENTGSDGWSSSDTGSSSIFDIFKGNQRAFNNFNQLTSIITESLANFSKLYNSI